MKPVIALQCSHTSDYDGNVFINGKLLDGQHAGHIGIILPQTPLDVLYYRSI